MLSIPAGMAIGIINAIGSNIVQWLIPKVGFHSRIKQLQVTTLTIFLMSFCNITLFMALEGPFYNWN